MQSLFMMMMLPSSPQIKYLTCTSIRIIDVRFSKFNILSNILLPIGENNRYVAYSISNTNHTYWL